MTRKVCLTLLVLTICFGTTYGQDRRVALIIGNSNYRSRTVTPLVNPANDARDLSQTLRNIGFTVRELTNATREEMQLAVDAFTLDLRGAEAGLFFFAGHGVQVNGRNYLIPVDAELPNSQVVPFRTIVADEVLASMTTAGAGLNLFFLDACRDNPLPAESRSLQRGLAVVGDRPPETMIVYATQANATAEDGQTRNSPFTQALLRHIPMPGLDVYDLYRNIAIEVQQSTAGRQRPEQFGNITARYSLASGSLGTFTGLSPVPALPAPVAAVITPGPTAEVSTAVVQEAEAKSSGPQPIEAAAWVENFAGSRIVTLWQYDGIDYPRDKWWGHSAVLGSVKDLAGLPPTLRTDLERYQSKLPVYKRQFLFRFSFGLTTLLMGFVPIVAGLNSYNNEQEYFITGIGMISGGLAIYLSALIPALKIPKENDALIDRYNQWVAKGQ
jgi:hypothetical protein